MYFVIVSLGSVRFFFLVLAVLCKSESDLMTYVAESICLPHLLLAKMPPLPTTAQVSHGAFLNGVS